MSSIPHSRGCHVGMKQLMGLLQMSAAGNAVSAGRQPPPRMQAGASGTGSPTGSIGGLDHSSSDGMDCVPLHGCCMHQHVSCRPGAACAGGHTGHAGVAHRQSPRLVEHNCVQVRGSLQNIAAAYEQPPAGLAQGLGPAVCCCSGQTAECACRASCMMRYAGPSKSAGPA